MAPVVCPIGVTVAAGKVEGMAGSWNDLANESAKGKTFMLDDFQEGIGQANLLNGFDLNATDPAELEHTKATLEHQKEFLRSYSTNAAPQLLSDFLGHTRGTLVEPDQVEPEEEARERAPA